MIIATAGHVDHGKTSLVQKLTGVDTDRLIEEKQRGLTIDLGFAYMDAETGGRLGFVDVPGHIRFINNMLAGVSAIDFALLVVAADDGVMPQTVEHLDVLKLLGIKNGAIALTKIDRCDEERIDAAMNEVRAMVSQSFLADADIYPVSSITGDGLDTLQLALDIAADELVSRHQDGLFRLAIDRRFSVHGAGIVVTGSIFAGDVKTGDNLTLMPQGLPVRVRGLHTQNQEAESATAGDRCAVNLTGAKLDIDDIHRGNWLTSNTSPATDRSDIRLTVLESEKRALSHWTPVHVHTAANHVTARVAILEASRIEPGQSGLAQLVMDEPINLCTGDRVVIRDQAALRTIGGGVVVDPWSPKRGRAKPARLEVLRCIDPESAADSLEALLAFSATGIDTVQFAQQFNLAQEQLDDLIGAIDIVALADGFVISPPHFESSATAIENALDQWHEDNPGKSGLPHNQIKSLFKAWPQALMDLAIERMRETGALEQAGNLLRRPGKGINLDDRELATFAKAEPLLAADPTRPPVLHELAKLLDQDPKSLEKVLNQVAKTGQLVKPIKNRFFVPEGMAQLKATLKQVADDNGPFTVQQYRDATGIGRNLCIELLEYFDRQGLTRRIGDTRQLVD